MAPPAEGRQRHLVGFSESSTVEIAAKLKDATWRENLRRCKEGEGCSWSMGELSSPSNFDVSQFVIEVSTIGEKIYKNHACVED